MSKIAELREKARQAVNKRALFGEDIDLSRYSVPADEQCYEENPSKLPVEVKRDMLNVGVMLDDLSQRAGTFLQIDQSVVHRSTAQDGLEVMSSLEALERYPWIEDYWWHAVAVDTDKFTAQVELDQNHGYFIRALPGVKAIVPVQACLYLAGANIAQKVHNIIIAEENSELHVITGCARGHQRAFGIHIGISEFYVKKNAKITFTMIHNWSPETAVRPRSGAIVEENGTFLSNYVCMKPVRSLQMYPTARCGGENAVVQFNSVLMSTPGSNLDIGSRVFLSARGSRAEIVSRALTTGGNVVARGHLIGEAPDVKGHLECRGLILSDVGYIYAIPELEGKLAGIDLTHEAAVGKIAEEELEYLMARGLTREEATSTIVKGFVSLEIKGLPDQLKEELQRAIEAVPLEVF